MPAYNELIIGLGGCGGRSIKEFRRTQALRADDWAAIEQSGTRMDYLYIDSNDDILNANDWSVFGHSIRLEPHQVIALKDGGVCPDIAVVARYPRVSPWIGDIIENYRRRANAGDAGEARRGLQMLSGAGQLRRFGRVLFANYAETIRTTLREKITALINGRNNAVTFRIFCTLGGGTGSGSLIDMITLIQSLCDFRNMRVKATVIVYAYVAANGGEAADAGSFYENQYCSLRDLNALIVRSFHPHVTGMPFDDPRNARFDLPLSVNRVYLSSDAAAGNPSLEKQIRSMTASCFDSIVYMHSYTSPSCLRAITDEDLVDVTPGEPDARGNIVRSYRFSALGSRRWRVPTTQIRELLTCDTEIRVWNSILNGKEQGEGVVRDVSRLDDFDISFAATPTFEVYDRMETEFLSSITGLHQSIMSEGKRGADVLTGLHASATKVIEQHVKTIQRNGTQIAKFNQSYTDACAEIKKNLLDSLDRTVSWDRVGYDVWGLNDVFKYLKNLRNSLQTWMDDNVPGSNNQERLQQQIAAIIANMQAREEEWAKLGLLTIHLTKLDERMIEAQYQDACSLVISSLKLFKRSVVSNLVNRIDEEIATIVTAVENFIEMVTATSAAAGVSVTTISAELAQNARVMDENAMEDMYAFDADNLTKVREEMAVKLELHEGEMSRYTDALREAVGDQGHMINCDADAKDGFVRAMRNGILSGTMKRVHDRACQDARCNSVLVGNIIDRLSQIGGPVEANWEDRLGRLVERFMRNIPVSIELGDCNDGLVKPQRSPVAAIVIGMPAGATNPNLVTWLKDKIRRSRPTNLTILDGREEFYDHHTSEEIRVLYVPYWMPCRFAQVTTYIEQRYQRTLEQQCSDLIYFANYEESGEDGRPAFNRPALTRGGEPDMENIQATELLSKLFVRVNGVARSVVVRGDRGISFATSVDRLDGVQYTEAYSITQVQFPGDAYRTDLNTAMRMAVVPTTTDDLYTSMTEAEKLEVYKHYQDQVATTPEGTAEWTAASDLRTRVRKWLQL